MILTPVLMLLTLFVLWAGRGGRAGLTADLAAEEAVTAAALCCEEDSGGAADREAVAESILEGRPGLDFLCVGGLRPDAPPDVSEGAPQFIQEQWLGFEGATVSGGVGVLGLRLACETDGAVAPLRGIFPTVTVRGQAAEIVHRRPRATGVGFDPERFAADEGDELSFTVTADPPAAQDITVTYGVNLSDNDTAVGAGDCVDADADYVLPSGSITIGAGTGSVDIDVPTCPDGLYEGNEHLSIVINAAEDSGGTSYLDVNRAAATGDITEIDYAPHLWLKPGSQDVVEGASFTFDLKLMDETGIHSAPSAQTVEVDVKTVDGTDPNPALRALAGSDYTQILPTTLTFDPGDVTIEVSVETLDDVANPVGELNEMFSLVLGDAHGAPLSTGGAKAEITILDDEARLSVDDVSANEGDSAGSTLEFVLSLDRTPALDVTVAYELQIDSLAMDDEDRATVGDNCGVPGTDFVPDGTDFDRVEDPGNPGTYVWRGSKTFGRASQTASVTVTTCPDVEVERDESFWLNVSVTDGEAVALPSPNDGASGTILNDDIPVLRVEDTTAKEGETLEFKVSLSVGASPARLSEAVSVEYEIVAVTATGPRESDPDYQFDPPNTAAGKLTFAAGVTSSQTVALGLLPDYLPEDDETVQLVLRNPSLDSMFDGDPDLLDDPNAELTAVGTIKDDPPPVLSVNDFSGSEGDTRSFTVTLTRARDGETVEVQYQIAGHGAAPNAATAPGVLVTDPDFQTKPDQNKLDGTLSFPPGTTTLNVDIELLHDLKIEQSELLRLTLLDPVGAVLFDRDPNNGDPDEAYGIGTIKDDPPPVLSVNDFSGSEGDTRSFTVTSTSARDGETVEVQYQIAGHGAAPNAATAPGVLVTDPDFQTKPDQNKLDGTLSFPLGTTALNVDIELLHDLKIEQSEKLRLTLLNPQHAILFDRDPNNGDPDEAYGIGTIEHVDPPRLIANDASAKEGQSLVFAVTLCNQRANETVTVRYRTDSVSAKAGRDYDADITGMLTFSPSTPGATAADHIAVCGLNPTSVKRLNVEAVSTLPDKISESPDQLALTLSDESNAAIDDGIAYGTIYDVPPAIVRVNNPEAVEGTDLEFVISLLQLRDEDNDGIPEEHPFPMDQLTGTVEVGYQTQHRDSAVEGPAVDPGADYLGANGSITFEPGNAGDSNWLKVPVTTYTDTVDEDDEIFALVLSVDPDDPIASPGDTEGTGTIRDQDPPALRITDATADEGSPLEFVVQLVAKDVHGNWAKTPTSKAVTFNIGVVDGGTASSTDIEAMRQVPLTLDAGETSLEYQVRTIGDDIPEPPETVYVAISGPSNATIDRAVGIGTINPKCIDVDDPNEPIPLMIATDIDVIEGKNGHPGLDFSQPLCDRSGGFSFVSRLGLGTATCADIAPHSCLPGDENQRTRATQWTYPDVELTGWARIATRDGIDEPNETWYLDYKWGNTMPLRYQSEDWVRGTVTIIDGDDEPRIFISDAVALEGEPLKFEVALDAASGRTVSFDWRTRDGSATAGVDYEPVDMWTRATIDPGTPGVLSSVVLEVLTSIDSDAGDETLFVDIRAPVVGDPNFVEAFARFLDTVGLGTITDGPRVKITVADAQAAEGGMLGFVVSLSEPAGSLVTVDYATVDLQPGLGSATAGLDYASVSSAPPGAPLVFAVGEQFKTVYVDALTDSDSEFDEQFLFELRDAQGAVSADSTAVGTILGNIDCVGPLPGEIWDNVSDTVQPVTARPLSVGEDAGFALIVVEFERPYCTTTTWTLTIGSDSTAARSADFVRPGALEVVALERELVIPLVLLDDNTVEGDETIVMEGRLGHFGYFEHSPLASWTITVTIVEDDATLLRLPADDATVTTEGDLLSFVVRLDKPTVEPVEFDYETSDGSTPAATQGDDYEPRRGTAAILPGRLSVTIPVRTIEDAFDEFDEEYVNLTVTKPVGAAPDPDGNVAVGRITDDDEPPGVSISNAAADEGDDLEFVVELDAESGRRTSVGFATRDGAGSDGATAPGDYGARSGRVSFDAGVTRQVVSVTALGDYEVEGDEEFFVDLPLGSGDGLLLDNRIGQGTIRDVTERQVSVADAFVDEGGVLVFEVGFEGTPRSQDITVEYTTAADSATAGDDYSAAFETRPGTVRILAGQTSATVRIQTELDRLDEEAERLYLRLSDPVGAALEDAEAAGVIIDDDPVPSLSIDDPEVTENGDGTPSVFTLTLSERSGRDVIVTYNTADITAVAGDDYTAPQAPDNQATIPAGDTSVTVEVALVDDSVAEEVERFQLVLSDPQHTRLADFVGVARILDDDGVPQILVDNPDPVREGDGVSVDFVVRLSRAATTDITVDYATEDATATATDDFVATSSPPALTFTAGELSRPVTVQLVNDSVIEQTETFRLKLSNASATVTIGTDTAVATILDDDDLPAMSVADTAATEGATASFTVSLSTESAQAITVEFEAIADPTAGGTAATPAQDFTAVSGTLTVPARSTEAIITVPLRDDALNEHIETFWLRLSDPSGARIVDGTATGTINDNDPLPQISIADAGEPEGETLRFAVTMNTASGRTVSVPWATEPRGVGDNLATPDDDYTAGSGTLTFTAGSDTAYINIATVDDDIDESDETFLVQLGEATFAALDDNTGVGAIRDNDSEPRIFIEDTRLLETDSPAVFRVTLSRRSSEPVTVDYQTSDGDGDNPATAGSDYATSTSGASGTLTIPAGLEIGEISVFVVDDDVAEDTETFDITLSNPTNAVVAADAGTATATILDNEQPRLSIGDAQASEGDGSIEFTVTLSHAYEIGAADGDVTVSYATFDGTAIQPEDYTAATGTVTIPAGDTTATVTVELAEDVFVEPTELFLVRLSNPVNADIAANEAAGSILDDDDLPRITVARPNIVESDGFLIWRVTLSHPSNLEVTVDYSSRGWNSGCIGSAPTIEGMLVFEHGSTTATVTVPVDDDNVACTPIGDSTISGWPRRYVHLFLSNPVNAELATTIVVGRVHDDDGKTLLSIKARNAGGLIGSESDGQLVFDLELGRPFAHDVTVPIRIDETQALEALIPPGPGWYDSYVSGPQATAASDFVARNANVTLPAGDVLVEVSVQIIDDDTVEETESFMALFESRTYTYFIAFNFLGRARITDNDSVNVDAEDIEVLESAGTAVFRLQLDRDNTLPVSVKYATVDGTATQPEDYTQTSGTATFDAGTRSVFVNVPIVDDDDEDEDETFELLLSAAVSATISDGSATATIRDDDGDDNLPVITIADASATESDYNNISLLCFAVTTSNHPGEPIAVDYESLEAPWLGDRAATPGVDYGIPSFQGNTRYISSAEDQICVNVLNDDIPEPDEMFIGWLSNPVGAVLGNRMAWGTIIDRDPPIVSVSEGSASESGGAVEFTLRLHAPDQEPSSLAYATEVHSPAGDTAAIPDQDYTHTSGRIDFAAGETMATVTVPITNDSIDEPDETFLLVLSDPDNLEVGDGIAVGTITDDDPGWWVDDVNVREGTATADFAVRRDHRGTDPFTLRYEVAPTGGSATGGDDCATDGVDFEFPSGSVVVQPTETEVTISVTICDDTTAESRETLLLELTNVDGRDLAAVATIIDNES